MSDNDVSHEVRFKFEYGARFRSQVDEGSTDPLTGVKILIDEEPLFGPPELNLFNGSYMTTTLLEMFDTIDDIKRGDSQVIEFANGPTYIVLEPQNDNNISITGCLTWACVRNTENRTEGEISRSVSVKKWVAELIRAAEEYVSTMLEINPSLAETKDMILLRRAIERANERHI